VFRRRLSEAPAQSLLRLSRNPNHAGGLPFAATGQRHANARPVLIMPGHFDEQSSDQRKARRCSALRGKEELMNWTGGVYVDVPHVATRMLVMLACLSPQIRDTAR
jgi:hypothetical protein